MTTAPAPHDQAQRRVGLHIKGWRVGTRSRARRARRPCPATDDLLDGCHLPRWQRSARWPRTDRPRIDDLPRRPEFTGEPPGLRTVQRGQLMLVYLTDSAARRGANKNSSP